jgi:hypothetical protein
LIKKTGRWKWQTIGLACKLRLIYLFYALIGEMEVFLGVATTENAGFSEFLDCDDSSADFNFRG